MPAKKKAKTKKAPTLEQQLAEARTENTQLRGQIDSMRVALIDQNDRTEQARLERDGLLQLIALASNDRNIAQVMTRPRVGLASTRPGLAPTSKS